jgi:hypothetical protein
MGEDPRRPSSDLHERYSPCLLANLPGLLLSKIVSIKVFERVHLLKGRRDHTAVVVEYGLCEAAKDIGL